MAMRVSEKRILNDHASVGTLVVEILTTVLLSLFAWLTYFAFLQINLLKSLNQPGTGLTLLCIILVPLAAALLTRIPKYGENQLYFWLVPELALFLVAVFTKIYPQGKGDSALKSWWGLLSKNPSDPKWTKWDLIPFASSSVSGANANQDHMTLAATLMFLAILLLISAIIADELCVHRRGVPLLLTLVPVLALIIAAKRHYPEGAVRWYLGIFLALLIFAMIFSIGKEKPRKFWKKHVNMGISVFLIMAVILSAIIGVLQNTDPDFLKAKNAAPKSTMNGKTQKMMENSGMPMGDLRNATQQAKDSNFRLEISTSNPLKQPVYFRMFTGENYNKVKWLGKLEHANNPELQKTVSKTLIPALITGTLARNDKYGTMTVKTMERENKKSKNFEPAKPSAIIPSYITILDDQFQTVAKAKLELKTFNQSVFEPKGDGNSKQGYTVNLARVDLSDFTPSQHINKDYQSAEEAYSAFVKANYTMLTNDEEKVLAPFVKMGWSPSRGVSFAKARTDVQKFLSDNFTLGDQAFDPKNEQPLEFLLSSPKNSKTGKYNINQIYTATLETLLLRSDGIPARYVEGLQFDPQSPKQVKKKEAGRVIYQLDNKNSHAWCEVYVDGRGWLPAELGPGKSGGSQNETKRIRSGGSGNQSANVQRRNAGSKNKKKRSAGKIALTIILSILAVAAVVIGLIFLILYIQKKQTLNRLRNSDGPENTFRGYRILMKDLRKKNYPASSQHPEWLLSYLGEDYARYLDFVYEERYSEAGLNSEERRFCKDFVLETISNMPKLKKEDLK